MQRKNNMGNTNAKKSNLKCHIVIHEWNKNGDVDLLAREEDYLQKDFLLTNNKNFFLNKERNFNWVEDFDKNPYTNCSTILKFDLNKTIPKKKKKLNSFIENISFNNNHVKNPIWELLNYKMENNNTNGTLLKEGDTLKIGKQIMRIKGLVSKQVLKKIKSFRSKKKLGCSIDDLDDINNTNKFFSIREMPEKNKIGSLSNILCQKDLQCRICLDSETENNRFHNFCNCIKTMPTHLSCLQMWLMKNADVNEENGITFYNFLNINCEICKKQFPSTYLNTVGEEIPLMEPKLPVNTPFLLFEIYQNQNPSIIKALMILDLSQERVLTLGRSAENDIIFKHHSISRNHCILKIKKKGVSIIDRGSKFGTYLLFKNQQLSVKESIILKMGKVLFEIHSFKKKPCDCIKLEDHVNLRVDPSDNINYLIEKFKQKSNVNNNEPEEAKKENFTKFSDLAPINEISEESESNKENKSKISDINESLNEFLNPSIIKKIKDDANDSKRSSLSFRTVLNRNTLKQSDFGRIKEFNEKRESKRQSKRESGMELNDSFSFQSELSDDSLKYNSSENLGFSGNLLFF